MERKYILKRFKEAKEEEEEAKKKQKKRQQISEPVSYTHLTLPTIYSV